MKFLTHLYRYILVVTILSFSNCTKSQNQTKKEFDPNITKSEIRKTKDGYRLFLNGEPFFVKGAGLANGGDMELLASHGANSFRTWGPENGKAVLDEAHKLGLKVSLGIWIALERHGFDYNDEVAVKKQLEEIRKVVLELKDHPALMLWGLGNEMNLQSTNPKVWDAVNDISKMIHELDPNHLTTTSLSGMDKKDIDLVQERASDLDFISIQMYRSIDILPTFIKNSGYKGPMLVTEWGATGYWEVAKTPWGAPIENTSSVKADLYLERYRKSIVGESQQVMGSFVFLWGQKQERTPTWFGMFMPDGNETESVDMMHYVWNDGKWPENRSPRLHEFTLEGKVPEDNIKLTKGKSYTANVKVTDPDGDPLEYIWEIMKESTSTKTGGDAEYIPESLNELFAGKPQSKASFKAPSNPGAYRLFIYVKDGNRHTAHANIPFWVE